MDDQAATTPPGARLDVLSGIAGAILTIGVTGHRASRLGDIDMVALADAVDATLEKIALAAAVPGLPVQLRLITALADGADTVAAECATRRGWLLASVLPFARDAYRGDFVTPQSVAAFDRLLAASHAVFELPAVHHADDIPAGYERAGRMVLAQSAMLVAVWDGRPALGRGGTAQIVAEAVAQAIPIVQIDPHRLTGPALLWEGPSGHGRPAVETVSRESLEALPELVAMLVRRTR